MIGKRPDGGRSLSCGLVCRMEVNNHVLGAHTSSRLKEVKQLRPLQEGSSSITTERTINWYPGEMVLFQG